MARKTTSPKETPCAHPEDKLVVYPDLPDVRWCSQCHDWVTTEELANRQLTNWGSW